MIDNKIQDYVTDQNNDFNNESNKKERHEKMKVRNLKVRSGIAFPCPKCKKIRNIYLLKERDDCIRNIASCDKCKYFFETEDDFNMIANIIKNKAKNLMFLYYRKKSTCSICKESNNTLFCRTKCSDKTCNGYMETDFDEMSIYQEFKFLNELANISQTSDPIIEDFNNAIKRITKYLKNINDKIIFTKVNISDIFSFLNSNK